MDTPAYLADLLAKLRDDPRNSSALAEASGVHAVSIRRFRSGEREPDHNTVVKLAAALGCDVRLMPAKKK